MAKLNLRGKRHNLKLSRIRPGSYPIPPFLTKRLNIKRFKANLHLTKAGFRHTATLCPKTYDRRSMVANAIEKNRAHIKQIDIIPIKNLTGIID